MTGHTLTKRTVWAAWIGSALEYYDFFLYGTAAVLFFGPLYFPSSDPKLGTLAAIASIGAGYISRVIGAFCFGHLGDRYGRRLVLCLTLSLMGASTFIIGLLPTYESIGIAAPILLIVLRMLQGFAVSGEQTSASTLILEIAPENRRGLYTSFSLSGTKVGFISASLVFASLTLFLSESEMVTWGWRVPFLLSVVLVMVGLWGRIKLPESPVFLRSSGRNENRLAPMRRLWKNYKLDVVRVVMAAQVAVVSTIFGVFSLSWAVNTVGIPRAVMLTVLTSCGIAGILVIPFCAYVSDRIGRKPVFLFGALVSGVLIWPYLWAISQANIYLIFIFGILLDAFVYSAANGVWPALYAEMFDVRVRVSGMVVGTQIGFMLAAQAPTIAAFVTGFSPSDWMPAALMVSASCSVSALAVSFARETSKVPMDSLGTKPPE